MPHTTRHQVLPDIITHKQINSDTLPSGHVFPVVSIHTVTMNTKLQFDNKDKWREMETTAPLKHACAVKPEVTRDATAQLPPSHPPPSAKVTQDEV